MGGGEASQPQLTVSLVLCTGGPTRAWHHTRPTPSRGNSPYGTSLTATAPISARGPVYYGPPSPPRLASPHRLLTWARGGPRTSSCFQARGGRERLGRATHAHCGRMGPTAPARCTRGRALPWKWNDGAGEWGTGVGQAPERGGVLEVG